MTRSRVIAGLSALAAAVTVAAGVGVQTASALQPNPLGNGLKPVLGWSSWSALRRAPTADLVKAEAEAMVSSGLKAAGYSYINLDDFYYQCPSSAGPNVDQWGRWVTDPTTFPPSGGKDGIAVLADYVHGLGLKFGIYLTPGISHQAVVQNTPVEASANGVELGTPSQYTASQIALGTTEQNYNCRGMQRLDWTGHPEGAQLYYNSLVDRFASWGVDFIKFDGIEDYSPPDLDAMAKAIAQSGNPHMLLDATEGDYTIAIADSIVKNTTQWEYTPDIENSGGTFNYTSYGNVALRFNSTALWQPYVGPGNFQDLDSVEIGNGSAPGIGGRVNGISVDGRKTLLSLWSLASSPLIIGPDLTRLDPVDKDLLTNPDMLAVDQDGIAASRIAGGAYTTSSTFQVFAKKEPNGDAVVGLFNTTNEAPESVTTTAAAIGLPASASGYRVTDLWTHRTSETAGTIGASVPPQGVAFYRVTPIGDAGQEPPSTAVNVSGPTTYSPGQAATVTATFTNTGVQAATAVQLSLAAPGGWTVSSTSGTAFSHVSTGQSVSATFRVVAPSTTGAGNALTATAAYGWPGGTPQSATSTEIVKVAPAVKINEVRTAVTGATTNQYIELYNAGGTAVDVSSWTVGYRSGANTTDTALATIPAGTTIPAGGYYLLGRTGGYNGSPAADQTFATNLSATSGALSLNDATGTLLVDSVGWGSATNALLENCPAPAPPTTAAPGSAIVRSPNGRDTDSNCGDFAVTTVPSPRALNVVGVSGTTSPSANVPNTLALTLGAPATFGTLTPGVTRDYAASMTASVLSTAGDASLSVTDPSATAPGHLVNGAFALPSPLQVAATSPAGAGGAFGPLSATPLTLLVYGAPVSNDPVRLTFQQHVDANDALRSGAYGKTLTFTLATTTP